MDTRAIITYGLLSIFLILALVQDVRCQRIPNLITVPAMLSGVILGIYGGGLQGFLFSLAGIAVGTGLLLLPYLLGGMGAGDAKLMGAVGGFLGPYRVFSAFLFTALIGGIYALLLILRHGNFKISSSRYASMAKWFLLTRKPMYLPPGEKERIPRLRYGIAIALGTMLSIIWGEGILKTAITGRFT